MVQSGIVTKIENDVALVDVLRDSACAGCSSAHSCIGCAKHIETRANNTLGAKVGDHVLIESSSKRILLYAFLVFVLPIVISIGVYVIVNKFLELYALYFAIGAMVLVLVIMLIALERHAKKHNDVNIIRIEMGE